MRLTYAGIGSQETPDNVLHEIVELANTLSQLNYILYSGGAPGADSAFESGASKKIIFLPWNGFNGKKEDGEIYIVPKYNLDYVKKYHPRPTQLSESGLKFMSRNTYQVLGPDLRSPVDFVVCWTKDGKASGGTGQALRIANDKGIPIFNLYDVECRSKLNTFLSFQNFLG